MKHLYERILITGANGLVGQELVTLLSRCPTFDVLATGRQEQSPLPEGSFGYTPLDITSARDVRNLCLDFAPTLIINCAAMTQVDRCEVERERCWEVNVKGVEYLTRAARQVGAGFIHLSTDFVFNGASGPYREEDRPEPINFYGRSKLASENIVRASGLSRWHIVRTVLLYGTGHKLPRKNIVLWALEKLAQGEPLRIVTDQWRTPTYAPDLARGIEQVIRHGRPGIYHISGRELLTVYDFIRRVAHFFDLDTSLVRPIDSISLGQIAVRPPRTGFVILKAETELGYRPRSIEAALADMSSRLPISTLTSP